MLDVRKTLLDGICPICYHLLRRDESIMCFLGGRYCVNCRKNLGVISVLFHSYQVGNGYMVSVLLENENDSRIVYDGEKLLFDDAIVENIDFEKFNKRAVSPSPRLPSANSGEGYNAPQNILCFVTT